MMFNNFCKKIAVDTLVYPWNVGLTCTNCAQQFTVTRRKKICVSCKCSYCTLCISRTPEKTFSCKKCIILTARPLNRDDLLTLKNKDLNDYLSARHISTTHCIEKEDLVNAVIRAVNHPARRSSSGSYPPSPRRTPAAPPAASRSQEDVRSDDGIRVTAIRSPTASSPGSELPFVLVDPLDCLPDASPAAASASEPEATPPKRLLISDINSQEDLDTLNVRQLKELLAYNRIDYTGCVERTELMNKVQRLYSDYVDRRKDVANLDQEELCKICMDAPIECVLLECGHVATCLLCGKQLNECPICRQYVIRCVRTFKA